MRVFVVDIEASGLDGWPVELGWSEIGSGSYRSFLIRPDPSWDHGLWDDCAEEMHGISLETLLAEGHSIFEVCRLFRDDIRGASLVSDAPAFDQHWLNMLFAETPFDAPKIEPIRITDLPESDDPDTPSTQHRAGPDALRISRMIEMSLDEKMR